jgi:AraC-like DNA-binding protein
VVGDGFAGRIGIDTPYFSSMFRKHFGTTPTAFPEAHRNRRRGPGMDLATSR